jgi:hypothetical protein
MSKRALASRNDPLIKPKSGFEMRSLDKVQWAMLAILVFLLTTSAWAAKPEEEWNRTYGGPYGDGAWSLQEAVDGGYIVTGFTSSQGQASDLWLANVDSSGQEEWEKTFGGSQEDVGYSVKQTRDNGYVVAGTTKSFGMGSEYLWLLKTDANGTKQWDRTFGGFVSSSGDGAWAVDEAQDGGYIITGYTRSFGAGAKDLWLVKTDANGKEQWERTFGGSKDDVGMSVLQAKDGGYVVAGRTASYGAGKDDIWLIKTNSDGREQWNRTFGGAEDDVGLQVVEAKDGYVITGRTESEGPYKKAFLMKTDLNGKMLWEKVYGEECTGISLQLTADQGIILAGYIESKDLGRDAWLVKTDASGNEQWNMRLGGIGQDMATSVVESSDGGYVVAGITSSYGAGAEDAWMAKVELENTTSASENAAGDLNSENNENTSKSDAVPKNIQPMTVKDLLRIHP